MEEGIDYFELNKGYEEISRQWDSAVRPTLACIDFNNSRVYTSRKLETTSGIKNKSHIPWLNGK